MNNSPAGQSSISMDLLSRLLLSPETASLAQVEALRTLTPDQFDSLMATAHANHVVVRAMKIYEAIMLGAGQKLLAENADRIVMTELGRIDRATKHLGPVLDAFQQEGIDVTVMKTLDHWPDFGSDIDLYTDAPYGTVCAIMQSRFNAHIAARSWGDRLAGKWNFEIPGLPEAIEIHMGRLGQTGEQTFLAANVSARARTLRFGDQLFPVPSASDRIMISTLQRMYRHFYFRLCDIIDSASLCNSGDLDYNDLQRSAQAAGIWEGVATYLVLVSDYVEKYSGDGIALPNFVKRSARFDGKVMYCGGLFLRVPILPQSADLYRSQLAGTLRRGEIHSSARLGLLPWLATAAAVGQKITGSDKGIW
jgi:hypothetical protein